MIETCIHDWRYSNQSEYINCSHRRVCFKCHKLQVRGKHKGDENEWFDSLGAAMQDWSDNKTRSEYWDKIELPVNKNHKETYGSGGCFKVVDGEVESLATADIKNPYNKK